MEDYIPIIAVALAIGVSLIQKALSGRGERRDATTPAPRRAAAPRRTAPARPATPPELPQAAQGVASIVSALSENVVEGMRVTSAEPEAPAPQPQRASTIKPPTLPQLRRAVIWSEILHRKF